MSDVELCPTCRQPLPRDAKSTDLRGASIKCEFCDAQASFIIKRCAVCYEHRSVPLEHAESMGNRDES